MLQRKNRPTPYLDRAAPRLMPAAISKPSFRRKPESSAKSGEAATGFRLSPE